VKLRFCREFPYQLHSGGLHDKFCIGRASWQYLVHIDYKDNFECVAKNDDIAEVLPQTADRTRRKISDILVTEKWRCKWILS